MLEFVIVYLLARRNGGTVQRKGHRPAMYYVATVALWFGGEILGAILGLLVIGNSEDSFLGVYGFGLAGAIVGALIGWYLANAAPTLGLPAMSGWTTHAVPAMGMPAWAQPDPAAQPLCVLPPGLPLSLLVQQGDWALVRATNGWQGWVDARLLVAAPRPQPATAITWS